PFSCYGLQCFKSEHHWGAGALCLWQVEFPHTYKPVYTLLKRMLNYFWASSAGSKTKRGGIWDILISSIAPGRRDKSMIEPKLLDELARKLAGAVPPSLQDFQKDLEKNFRAVLTSTFAKLDLVTREEFDIQRAVLERT